MTGLEYADIEDILDIVGDRVPPHTERAIAKGCPLIEHDVEFEDEDSYVEG